MISHEKLKSIHLFSHISDPILHELAQAANEKTFLKEEFIIHQHDEANYLYLLLDGTIQILLRFEGIDDLIVGSTNKPFTLIGWSAFRIPYRHTASVKCEEDCHVLVFPAQLLNRICDEHPKFGFLFLRKIAATLADRLESTREILFKLPSKSSGESSEDTFI